MTDPWEPALRQKTLEFWFFIGTLIGFLVMFILITAKEVC